MMLNDRKLFFGLLALLIIPIVTAFIMFGKDHFRYQCQDPANWSSEQCKPPICDVTRSCPEHVFKGQRDPRLGPPPAVFATPPPSCPSSCVVGVQDGNQK
jgi:hypothetical protein